VTEQRKTPDIVAPIERECRVCGCTDDWACPEGCWWVEEDLCSACVEMMTSSSRVPA